MRGPFWAPITPLTGSFFHADPHGTVAKLRRKLVPCSAHHSSFLQIGASGKPGTLHSSTASSILVVDGDVVSRHMIADYLRHCGYSVVEAANTTESFVALKEPTLSIDVILCDVSMLGSQSGFELANWVRANRPEFQVRLAGGVNVAAQKAAELCETGPDAAKPSEPEAIVNYIKRLRASRAT